MQKIINNPQGEFRLRKYQPGDQGMVLSLWENAFSKKMSEDLWEWKYLNSPYVSPKVVCHKISDQMVVFYGGISYDSVFNGKSGSITQLMDIMSHPDYRKSGLFIETANFFFELLDMEDGPLFLYGFPGKYHLDIGAKYLNYMALDAPVQFLRTDLKSLMSNHTSTSPGKIENVSNPSAAFDFLWEELKHRYSLSVKRNAKFLKWRFLSHPSVKYQIICFFKDTKKFPKAYMVLSFFEKSIRIVDFLFPSDEDVVGSFFFQIAKDFHRKGFESIETWLPSAHFSSILLRNLSFETYAEPFGFIPTIRPFNRCPDFSLVSDNLFYTMADGDLL